MALDYTTADHQESTRLPRYHGDRMTCLECGTQVRWSRLSDGTWGYVDAHDAAVCRDQNDPDATYELHEVA